MTFKLGFHELRSFWRAEAYSLFSDVCSSKSNFLNAGLDQSVAASCRALSQSECFHDLGFRLTVYTQEE